jgi:hypothetical protein
LHRRVLLVDDLVEGEALVEARAATTRDEHPQLEVGVALLVDQRPDLVAAASVNTSGADTKLPSGVSGTNSGTGQ